MEKLNFSKVQFKGTFRDYQQTVLDNSNKYLKNGKIHIVAAPGSGKTILGLELISRLREPALIFSPTITIKNQWKSRFDMFVSSEKENDELFSLNLKEPLLFTSTTYQSLHSAMNKLKKGTKETLDSDDESLEEEQQDENFEDFDLIATVKNKGIKTICLDEAHHLRNEWHKALIEFLSALGSDIKIIALTATPPYDSDDNEWNKYISLCGEIDQEVLVPELVQKKNLCKHQDFVYCNFPTEKEIEVAKKYQEKTELAIKEIAESEAFQNIMLLSVTHFETNIDKFLEYLPMFSGAYTIAEHFAIPTNAKVLKYLKNKTTLNTYSLSVVLKWLNDLKTNAKFYGEEYYISFETILKEYGLISKNKIYLGSNPKINKEIMTSQSKMQSILEIIKHEKDNLKADLRMLILTDYIKKAGMKAIGTENDIDNISVVSIFEYARRQNPETNLAVLCGTLVIIRNNILKEFEQTCKNHGCKYTLKPLENTDYVECVFIGVNNKNKVNIVTELFQAGHIQIVIGTKSLLGEGWDSPNINSLIFASFVGSFMLSNQVRGRAIRVDKNQPNKISNIWHLVTVMPNENNSSEDICSYNLTDYQTLERRFKTFLAPNYETNEIEYGIERCQVPLTFNQENLPEYNEKIMTLAADRENTSKSWDIALGNGPSEVIQGNIVKSKAKAPFIGLYDFLKPAFKLSIFAIALMLVNLIIKNQTFKALSITVVAVGLAFLVLRQVYYVFNTRNLKCLIKSLSSAVLKSLKRDDVINFGAKVKIKPFENDKSSVFYSLVKTENKEQSNIFLKAMQEILGPVQDPRYILVKKKIISKNFRLSICVPKLIGSNKDKTTYFNKCIKRRMGLYLGVYTRTDDGFKVLQKVKNLSYFNNCFELTTKSVVKKGKQLPKAPFKK
ncbi:MAG: DEAD/DEAH box helicase family protein [Clostridia bacterium]|nr:DEAD/DEAH box helicase family protein [Clostridia bacterium]